MESLSTFWNKIHRKYSKSNEYSEPNWLILFLLDKTKWYKGEYCYYEKLAFVKINI